jgi:hypothetical protein
VPSFDADGTGSTGRLTKLSLPMRMHLKLIGWSVSKGIETRQLQPACNLHREARAGEGSYLTVAGFEGFQSTPRLRM